MSAESNWWREYLWGDDGLLLHARVTGTSGAPLVLCHGFGLSAFAWDRMVVNLPERRIVAIDFRGHGDSEWDPTACYDRAAIAEDVRAILDALAIERCILVGHSFGGDIVARLAREHASRVAGLVLIDVGPEIRPSGMRLVRGLTDRMPAVYTSRAEYREWLETIYPLADALALTILAANGLRTGPDGGFESKLDPAFRRAMFAFEETASQDARWALLETIQQPTLIVRGAESVVLSEHTAQRMTRVLKKGCHAVVPDAGHSVMLDNPRGMATVLQDFLGRVA
ncbi:alpha/beta hydrolase [Pendulispora rubella]|uniref:Alpha/beta hydrolase n=1 Tax=Pendulispora rubella TaxID=2741070 RepID=A0ABZ2L1B0_9BACT